ncbi:MAG: restriction endonuclease subunit S, partial [Alcaligenaceae bacterium]|nr:restriction endonuclease subunit S [Alcaligenaceae bacterium]
MGVMIDGLHSFIYRLDIVSKYLFYFLLTQKHKILSQVRRASIPRLSKSAIASLEIPIPSMAEQARIVAI